MTIRQIQDLLHYLGYDLTPDGIWGPETEAAVREFQEDYGGIAVDGDPGRATQMALRDSVAYDKFRPVSKSDTESTPQSPGGDSSPEGEPLWWKDVKYWTRAEFGCQCANYNGPYCDGFPVEPDEVLVRLADRVRGHFGRPGHRSSGIRCPQHNADSGGVSNSKHMEGKALDFFVEGVSGQELLAYIQAQPETNYAYIISGQYVHMNV